jgi:hypothetical protein
MISKELDSVPKYRILEPTWPHWASIQKVVGSIPIVARHIIQACSVWIYTQSNITEASYSPEYITPTQQISWLLDYTDIEGMSRIFIDNSPKGLFSDNI